VTEIRADKDAISRRLRLQHNIVSLAKVVNHYGGCHEKIEAYLQMLAVLAAATLIGGQLQAADINYGKPGEPVELVIGYQPYYTESWSGVVMRSKKFLREIPAQRFQGGIPDRAPGRDHRQ